jgi:acetyl/propionyl-CoA carboxylase alpha subunit
MKGKRVLIINRGEIAIRIAKALNELGLVSVGVWTDNEPEPPHLEFCKEWVYLSGSNNKETYLNIQKIDLLSVLSLLLSFHQIRFECNIVL